MQKVVSGGQTGVDRVALDVAIFLDIPHGGWCPKGRRAEDGRVPDTYELRETDSRDYSVRTEQNVVDSDGTLILYTEKLTGGSELTRKLAKKNQRPVRCIDLGDFENSRECSLVEGARRWIDENNVCVLNVAGPRESSNPIAARKSEQFLLHLLEIK